MKKENPYAAAKPLTDEKESVEMDGSHPRAHSLCLETWIPIVSRDA